MKYRLAQVRVYLVAEALLMAGCGDGSSTSAAMTQRPPPPRSPPPPPTLDPHYASAQSPFPAAAPQDPLQMHRESAQWQRSAQDNVARALRARRPDVPRSN